MMIWASASDDQKPNGLPAMCGSISALLEPVSEERENHVH